MTKLAIEVVDEGKEKVLIADGRVDVAERVGDALEAAGERGDGQITLREDMEHVLAIDGVLKMIVEEEVVVGNPHAFGHVRGLDDDVEMS